MYISVRTFTWNLERPAGKEYFIFYSMRNRNPKHTDVIGMLLHITHPWEIRLMI